MMAVNMNQENQVPGNNAYTGGDLYGSNMPSSDRKAMDKKKENSGFSFKSLLLIVVIFAIVRFFVAEPFLVFGKSMEPNFKGGDYLIVDEISYKITNPKRGDVIVLRPPLENQAKEHFIKRIVGLPGETIIVAGSKVTIKNADNPKGFVLNEPYITYQSNQEAIQVLKDDEYFVMGDNRAVSDDSRRWGPLKREAITGRPVLRLFPLDNISLFPGSAVPQSK